MGIYLLVVSVTQLVECDKDKSRVTGSNPVADYQ